MQTQVTIDTNRAFSKASRYFSTPESAFTEAIQNAHRSYLPIPAGTHPEIRITHTDTEYIFEDDGRGIDDPIKMLSLSTSEWSHDVEGDQDPAGMGCCGILAFCRAATWTSRFGSLTVNSESFFNDAAYRDSLFGSIDRVARREVGTRLVLHDFRCRQDLVHVGRSEWYRDVSVSVNGKPMTPTYIPAFICNVPGYASEIRSSYGQQNHGAIGLSGSISVVCAWHGHLIPVEGIKLASITHKTPGGRDITYRPSTYKGLEMLIVVNDENVITPRLPDRGGVQADERTVAFITLAWETLVARYHLRLMHRLADEPESYAAFKALQKDPAGVDGYAAAFLAETRWTHGDTNTLRQQGSHGYERLHEAERHVVEKDHARYYDPVDVLVIDASGESIEPVGDEPYSLLFDRGTSDPLAAAGLYRRSSADTQLIFYFKGETLPVPGSGKAVTTLPVVLAVPLDDYERERLLDLDEYVAANPDCVVDIGGTETIWFSSASIEYPDDLIKSLWVCDVRNFVTRAITVAQRVLDDVHSSWANYTFLEHSDSEDPQGDYREARDTWGRSWDEFYARLAGLQHIPHNLDRLGHALPGMPRKFTLDLDAKTVTGPDGVAHAITWS